MNKMNKKGGFFGTLFIIIIFLLVIGALLYHFAPDVLRSIPVYGNIIIKIATLVKGVLGR